MKKSGNNCYIYKSKYLLFVSGNNIGGIYIIDLNLFEKIAFQKFTHYIYLYSIIPSKKENVIIVSSVFNNRNNQCRHTIKNGEKKNNSLKKNFNKGRLVSIEIEENNNTISLKIKNYSEGGNYYYINCQKPFLDEYFFTSIYKTNSLVRMKENGTFIEYFEVLD